MSDIWKMSDIYVKKEVKNGLIASEFILTLQKTSSPDIRFEIKFYQFIT